MVSNGLYALRGKRVMDFSVALTGLLFLGPLLILLALLVLLFDGPPVFFRQKRLGRGCRPFTIYKFRTMRRATETGSSITVAGDARTTGLGRVLRRLKLDELPQLWNVLRGEMSLVGPRPDVPGYLDRLRGEARALWELKPGITGPGTLFFRHEEELLAGVADRVRFNDEVIFPQKVRLNLVYLQRCSFSIDLLCLLATVAPAVLPWLGFDRSLGFEPRPFEPRTREGARKKCPC